MAGRWWDWLAVQAAALVLGAAMFFALPAADGVGGARRAWAQEQPAATATATAPLPTAAGPASGAPPPAATVIAQDSGAPGVSATAEPASGTPLATGAAAGPPASPTTADAPPTGAAPAATPTAAAIGTAPVPPPTAPLPTAAESPAGTAGRAVADTAPDSAAGANAALSGDGAVGPGRVLYADSFASPTSGWPAQSSDAATRRVGYADGAYVVARLPGSGGSPYVMREERFGDFLLQVDARLVEPTADAYVFVDFRRQENGEHYSFVVAPDEGSFIVRRNTDRDGVTVLDWTRSAAIQRGAATNRLGVRAQGAEVTLLVNGEEVGRARADELREGGIGFGVGSLGDGAAEARFTNLVVVSVE